VTSLPVTSLPVTPTPTPLCPSVLPTPYTPPSFPLRLIDGKKIDSLTKDDTTLARKPMYGAFSVWTKDSNDFGGPAPKSGPNWSFFSDIRRLVCDDIKIDPAFLAPVATPVPTKATVSDGVESTKAAANATVQAGSIASGASSNVTVGGASSSVGATPSGGAGMPSTNGAASAAAGAAAGALAAAAAAAAAFVL
jgi:hypothetical protein